MLFRDTEGKVVNIARLQFATDEELYNTLLVCHGGTASVRASESGLTKVLELLQSTGSRRRQPVRKEQGRQRS